MKITPKAILDTDNIILRAKDFSVRAEVTSNVELMQAHALRSIASSLLALVAMEYKGDDNE